MTAQPLSQAHVRKLRRAIIEFDLIRPGDRVLLGLSGGKDSAFLLFALAAICKHPPVPFSLAALTIDTGLAPLDRDRLRSFSAALSVPLHMQETDMQSIIRTRPHQSPCAVCAYFRRAVLCRFAAQHGYGSVALAHHLDDAVETFLMNQFHGGQLKTLSPKSHMHRTGVTVIRPLVYFRESETRRAIGLHGFTPQAECCPHEDHTARARVKELLRHLGRDVRGVVRNVAAAMRADRVRELWPPEPPRSVLLARAHDLARQTDTPPEEEAP